LFPLFFLERRKPNYSELQVMEVPVMEALNVIAIIVAGLMVGDELAIAMFVNPALDRLPDDVHLPAASVLARVLGRFMPFWYILVFLLTLAVALARWHESGQLPIWIATSAILWVLAGVYSIITLVPINNRIASWAKVTHLPIGRNFGADGTCFTVNAIRSEIPALTRTFALIEGSLLENNAHSRMRFRERWR
jgi:uncharacterized membrane protein